MPRLVPSLLGVALLTAPLGAQAADLVVWWEEGYYAQEDEAVREIIAAFEQETGKQVDLALHPQAELPNKIAAALEGGRPPDFAFSLPLTNWVSEWALDNHLVDLSDSIGHFSDLFDPDLLNRAVLLNAKTGQKALYALPMGRATHHLHVWGSLLKQAGFTLEDIPKEWEVFWSFWCDQVQPAVRRATGRDDVWGIGLAMSVKGNDTVNAFHQFISAYRADYVTRDGRLVIDDPEIRQRLVKAIGSYTAIYRNGCTPPDAVTWADSGNNKQFLAQAVVMVANETLSIPNALKRERPDDYYNNTATIEWPLGPDGEGFPIRGSFFAAVVFKDGGNVATAKEFVRFMVSEGWLAHYLDFSGERMLPPMPKLLEQPFWLDPSERLAPGPFLGALAALQIAGRHDPEASARLDRSAAQQNAPLPAAYGTDHDLGIEVMDLAARTADVALERVALGPAQHDRRAALAAKAHRRRPLSAS